MEETQVVSDFVRQRPSESVGGVKLGYAKVPRIHEDPLRACRFAWDQELRAWQVGFGAIGFACPTGSP